jgi:circadian clock protein KaiC
MGSGHRRLSTGIDRLDTVVGGGYIEGRSYLLHGPAGSGKTILGFHFLEACGEDEQGLFINLEEELSDLRTNAASLGFDTDPVEFLDLSPGAEAFAEDRTYEVFSAADVEWEPLAEAVMEAVERVEPDRVVIDPLTQFRHLIDDGFQFRKQVVGLMRYLKTQGATVVFTVQETRQTPSEDLQFISDGYLTVTNDGDRRRLAVPKFRGSATKDGAHAYRITGEGIEVYPELEPDGHSRQFPSEVLSSGVAEVDDLLHGGVERGSVTIVSGPTGVGKTTLCTQFAHEAATRGERSVVYLFEEARETFARRSEAVGIPVERMVEDGHLRVEEVEGLDLSPQEFAARVREEVEDRGAELVMVDGLSGYRITLDNEEEVLRHVHALGRYLKNIGVTTLLVDETSAVFGEFRATEHNVSYIADNIVVLRHLELGGELRKAVGVLKKRTSDYERTLREYAITEDGIRVGEPLTGLRGILSGTPEFVDGGGHEPIDGG